MKHSTKTLVDLLRAAGSLDDPIMEAAFREVPREHFLPKLTPEEVYVDQAIVTKSTPSGIAVSSSSQPSMMLQMLKQLQLGPGHNVLEIGTGTGYNAAIMKHIVGPTGKVTTIEIDADIAQQAERNLQKAHALDVKVVNNDGAQGYAPRAAYDRIICTAGIWDVPKIWINQLKSRGILVTPIQMGGAQVSAAFHLGEDGTLFSEQNLPCRFVYLRGIASAPEITKRIGSTSLTIIADNVERMDPAAIHLLLSADHDRCTLQGVLENREFWFGFVPYAILNRPSGSMIAVYFVGHETQSYGMEGTGVAMFMPASAVFLSDNGNMEAHCFAGADAVLALENIFLEWRSLKSPDLRSLRLHLIPKTQDRPDVDVGRVYTRHDHYLHAWLDVKQPR